MITLGEGRTPLLAAPRLSERFGVELWLKWEGANPTGSFKDRGMSVAVTRAVERGITRIVCASTGNTAASCAAYAARAGIEAVIVVAAGGAASSKLVQVRAVGGRIVEVDGSFSDAYAHAEELASQPGHVLVNSTNPHRIEGQKTAAFEICDALGDAPDVHCMPVGNAGNITAYWRGYVEYSRDGVSKRQPRMLGWQAAGAAPLVHGEPVPHPETIATAIRIGNPASWDGAITARDESGGAIESVTDAQILEAYRALASLEGVFVEPASAASVAGLLQASKTGLIAPGETVVCTVTGHGLKDPNRAIAEIDARPAVDAAVDVVLEELGL